MLNERLKLLREERDLKQKDMAKYLDITPSAYGYYEQGEREPDLKTLNRLADYFNVTIDYLLGRSDIRNYKELEEKLSSGQLKVLAAHRSDNPLDELPPKARKSLEDAIRYIREEENKNQGDKPHD